MRYLKHPGKREREQYIPFVQDSFTRMIRDIPATKCPNDSVVDAQNVLLFGDRFKVRPGSSQWSATKLPSVGTLTSITKTGNQVEPAEDIQDYQGYYIVYPNGHVDQVTDPVSDNSYYTVDNTTALDDETAIVYGQIHAIIWHNKSQKIFIHIDNRVFYTDYAITAWTKVHSSLGALGDTNSTFKEYNDYLYIFNDSGIFRIDTDQTPYLMAQINSDVLLNQITFDANYSSIETQSNPYGRRYVYAMSRIAGTGIIRSRLDGDKIIKETAGNLVDANDEYKDHKEMWVANQGSSKSNTTVDYLYHLIADFASLQYLIGNITSFTQTIYVDGVTKTAIFILDLSDVVTWEDYATAFTRDIRKAFPDYPTITCKYTGTSIVVYGGKTNISMGNYVPEGDFNFITFTTAELVGYNAFNILPFQNKHWTHYSIYSTAYFSTFDENYNLINKNQLIFNKDLRVAGIISFDIVSNLLHILSGELEHADVGSVLTDYYGRKLKILNSNYNVSLPTSSVVYNASLGAEDLRRGNVSSNVYTLLAHYTGNVTDIQTGHIIDTNSDFIALDICHEDLFINDTTDNRTSINEPNIKKGFNVGEVGTVLYDPFANFLIDYEYDAWKIYFHNQAFYDFVATWVDTNTIIQDGTWKSGPYTIFPSDTLKTNLTLSSDIFPDIGDGYSVYRRPFTIDDVGKTLYWKDGSTSIIIEFIDYKSVRLNYSPNRTNEYCVSNISLGRTFNDVVEDTEILGRQTDFLLAGRFNIPLPSGNLGEITSGYFNVTKRLENKVYYSGFNFDNIYLVGHYRANYQFLEVQDRIIDIREMTASMIIFCANSTWRTETNVQNLIDDEKIPDEFIAVQKTPTILDSFIGASDRGGITDIGVGQKVVITSEPGIRIFDGYRYSENYAIDEQGRGAILKDLQKLRQKFVSIYEPNLYGFMFWGSNTTEVIEGKDISKTSVCYRLAARPTQGFGISELNGDDWLWPNLSGGPLMINDTSEEKFLIVFDYRSMKAYKLDTRSYSALSGRTISYLDKATTEIEWSLKFKEHIAQEENQKLKFIEQYFSFRPNDEAKRNQTGYDSYGFKKNLTVKIEAFKDGEISNSAEVNANRKESVVIYGVNQLGTLKPNLAYPYNIEGHRLQHKISGVGSELECIQYRVLYSISNVIVAPQKVTSERALQRELSIPSFWISRLYDKQLNIVTQKGVDSLVGLTIGTSLGPDGNTNSSMYLVDDDEYVWSDIPFAISKRVFFWVRVNATGSFNYVEFDLNHAYLELNIIETGFTLLYDSVIVTLETVDFTSGVFLSIDKTASNITIKAYDNNGLLILTVTEAITDIGVGEGKVKMTGDLSSVFDFRIYDQNNKPSENVVTYWMNDILNYKGYSLLPENVT